MSNSLKYRQRSCRAFRRHTVEEWWGCKLSLGGFILHPCHRTCNKLVYPRFQIEGWGNRLGIMAAKGGYHSYSINTTAHRSYDREFWWWLDPSTQMTDGMEGLASVETYSKKGFTGYTHSRSIHPQRPVALQVQVHNPMAKGNHCTVCLFILSYSSSLCLLLLSFFFFSQGQQARRNSHRTI